MRKVLITAIISLLPLFGVGAAGGAPYDSFMGRNYVWLDKLSLEPSALIAEIEKQCSNRLVFIYVSGCALDEELIPVYQEMSQKYPDVNFLRIGQFSTARRYLGERYNVAGSPHAMLLKDRTQVAGYAEQYEIVNGEYKALSRSESMRKWVSTVYPVMKSIEKLPNVHGLSDFTFRTLMDGRNTVLLRIPYDAPDLPVHIAALASMARKFPSITFIFEAGGAGTAGESALKYRDAQNGFSVISDIDIISSVYRRPNGKKEYDEAGLGAWIASSVSVPAKNAKPAYPAQPLASSADGSLLLKMFREQDTQQIVSISPEMFSRMSNGGSSLNDFSAYMLFDQVLAAAGDRRMHPDTARQILELLEYKSRGGISKTLPQRTYISNYYSVHLKRLRKSEQRPVVQNTLDRLIAQYDSAIMLEAQQTFQTDGSSSASAPANLNTLAVQLGLKMNINVGNADFISRSELEVLAEINLVRTNPAAYAAFLREYRRNINGLELRIPGKKMVKLKEGVRAIDEAIAVLSKTKPLPPFTLSRGLTLSSRDHAKDLVKTAGYGHVGSDGSKVGKRAVKYGSWKKAVGENIAYGPSIAREIVIGLLADDGVKDRRHRKVILDSNYRTAGVAIEFNHPAYGPICVQNFAGEYAEKPVPVPGK